jgi:uncharacterized caspase-like protein
VEAKRLAFVVGINDYERIEKLKKAIGDAAGVAETLASRQFRVMKSLNADETAFIQDWERFKAEIEPGDEIAFFFSGHGVEVDHVNYLVPRDALGPEAGETLVKRVSRFD